MKRLIKGSIGLAALAAVGLCFWWMAAQEIRQASATSGQPFKPGENSIPEMSAWKIQRDILKKEIADRFAAHPVLDQRETAVKMETGETQVRRVRLVKDDSLKYSLVRVEDELVRSSTGDKLVRQSAMVGDHVMVKLRDPEDGGGGAARVAR